MRLHRAATIEYKELPLLSCVNAGFNEMVARHQHRHTSVIIVEAGDRRVRCIIDSEDSFFCMAGLLEHADLYFCSGYNAKFFKEHIFTPPYAWYEPCEVEQYKKKACELVKLYGAQFHRVRPFVPIGPNLDLRDPPGFAARKIRNTYDKLVRRIGISEPWLFTYIDFGRRYSQLLKLRNENIKHDIVLLDTLWGWPRHRYSLHRRLQEVNKAGFDVHARLSWNPPSEFDGSTKFPLDREEFPIETGRIGNYEAMLAASRLAVFATGFHWGWRNIMTLALMWGLPVLSDRLLLQPWFDMKHFEISWNDYADWDTLKATIEMTTDEERTRIKAKNQRAFDAFLSPEKVAEYFISTAVENNIALASHH